MNLTNEEIEYACCCVCLLEYSTSVPLRQGTTHPPDHPLYNTPPPCSTPLRLQDHSTSLTTLLAFFLHPCLLPIYYLGRYLVITSD